MLIILFALIVLMLSAVTIIDARRDAQEKARKSLAAYTDQSHFY